MTKFDLLGIRSRKRFLLSISLLLIIVLVSSCLFFVFKDKTPFVSNDSDKANSTEEKLREAVNNAIEPIIIALDNDVTLTNSVFTIPAGKNITLTSNSNKEFYKLIGTNEASTIFVEKGGVLRLDGIIVTHVSGEVGCGVEVYFGGTLIMLDGVISNNYGGGVRNSGSFSMYGGEISNNTVYGSGGGVYNNGYDFSMYGGKISANTALNGGGVGNWNGKVSLYDGNISGNYANGVGGGVDIYYGSFVMSGGAISANTAGDKGGGVYNYYSFSVFNLSGGKISNNTAPLGGGVCNDDAFTMIGGEISNNTANTGGGVYIGNGNFNQSGGKIFSNTASHSYDDIYNKK